MIVAETTPIDQPVPTTYAFADLDDRAQQRVLERCWSETLSDDWWYEGITDDLGTFGRVSGLGCAYGKGFDCDRASYVCLKRFDTTLTALLDAREKARAEFPGMCDAVLAPFFAAFTPTQWRHLLRLERWRQLGELSGGTEHTGHNRYRVWADVERWDETEHATPRVTALLDKLAVAWDDCVRALEHAVLTQLRDELDYQTSTERIARDCEELERRFTEDGDDA